MKNLSFSLPLAFCCYIAQDHAVIVSALAPVDSRRAFLNRAASAATGTTMGWILAQQTGGFHPGGCACGQCAGGATMMTQQQQRQHSAGCSCGMCSGGASHVPGCQCGSCVASQHSAGCTCGSCLAGHDAGCSCGVCSSGHNVGCNCGLCGGAVASLGFRPPSAYAYEKRVVGGSNPSATTAAFNIQSEKTYDRLEKSGYKLESTESEKARLMDSLSSYSYSPTSSSTGNGVGKKGKATK